MDFAQIYEQLRTLDWTPIVLAVLCGGAIGLERELHGRPAGLRTHMLVCLCSTMLIEGATRVPTISGAENANIVLDPQRLAAGIVTGIGFLGAAAAVRSGDMVRGLTTGATIWGVAGLGVIIGHGAYGYAIITTAMAIVILVVLDYLPRGFGTVIYRRLRVQGTGPQVEAVSKQVSKLLREHRIRLQEISGELEAGGKSFQLTFHVRCRNSPDTPRIMDQIARVEHVTRADWTAPRR